MSRVQLVTGAKQRPLWIPDSEECAMWIAAACVKHGVVWMERVGVFCANAGSVALYAVNGYVFRYNQPGMGVLCAVLDTGSTHKTVEWLTDLFCRPGRKTARKLAKVVMQPRAAKRRTRQVQPVKCVVQ